MKHTPAPWVIGYHGYNCVVETPTGTLIAECTPSGAKNARLIAAAPELLAALQEAERIAQEPDKFRSLQERESAIIAWKQQARAAIKKATGEI